MVSDKNKTISEKSMAIGLLIVAIAGFGLLDSGTRIIMNNNTQAEARQEQANNPTRVEAGGGNSTDVKTAFVPQSTEIEAG